MSSDTSNMTNELIWHKFTKNTMPEGECRILVCRDYGHNPFFVTVTVCIEDMTYCAFDGIRDFVPEPRDRWTYIPLPKGAIKT